MNNNPPRLIVAPIALIFSVFSLTSGIYMALITKGQNVYAVSTFLPFYFSILSFASGYLYKSLSKSPVTVFLIGGYFIRMVVQPLLFCIGGYVSFYHIDISTFNVIKAVFLLCLENTFVFAVGNHYSRFSLNSDNQSKIEPKMYDTKIVGWVLALLGLFLLYAYNTIPSLKSIYLFLPTADISQLASIHWDNETIVARGSISRYIYTLFMFTWPIVRSILPAFCISQIYSRYGNSSKAIALSMFCLLIPSIFLGGDNIAPFMGAIYGLLVMHRLYGKKINKIVGFACIVFGTAFITIVSAKVMAYQSWRGSNGISSVSQIINAYFPGFENMAIGFSIVDQNKLNTLFFDFYYGIPFKETIFGFSGDNLTNLYTQASQTGGQIVPWGYQLAHYISIFGSPILTALFVSYAYKSENISKTTDDFWEYYKKMYISVLTAMSISIYSFSIYFRSYLNVLLPVMIIIWLGNKKRRIPERKNNNQIKLTERELQN